MEIIDIKLKSVEGKSVIDIIRTRTSWRSYSSKDLEPDVKQKLERLLNKNIIGPFGNKVIIKLVSKDLPENKALKLGTFGFIKNAKLFLVGIIASGKLNMLDFGYVFEKIILEATALNLATCWLGGTFKRGEFARSVNLNKDEIIPSISPVGYPSGSRSINDKLIRMGAGSHKRKAFDKLFFKNSFSKPLRSEDCGKYSTVLEMLRLAPSASNRQPWRIIYENNYANFHFYLSRDKNYQKINRNVDLQMIDMGIAMCHFDLSSKELGLRGKWEVKSNNIDQKNDEYLFTWAEQTTSDQ